MMKWLKDKESVSEEKLIENKREAWAVYAAAYDTDHAARWTAYATDYFAYARTAYWVSEYFALTGEDKNEYEKELNK